MLWEHCTGTAPPPSPLPLIFLSLHLCLKSLSVAWLLLTPHPPHHPTHNPSPSYIPLSTHSWSSSQIFWSLTCTQGRVKRSSWWSPCSLLGMWRTGWGMWRSPWRPVCGKTSTSRYKHTHRSDSQKKWKQKTNKYTHVLYIHILIVRTWKCIDIALIIDADILSSSHPSMS